MSASTPLYSNTGKNSDPCYRFVPHVGEYISFSLDVRRTLDLLRCDIDDETEEAIQKFPVRKYVAVVQDHLDLPMPGRPFERTGLRLLQQGLIDPDPDFCVDSYMCFPVAPETSHPMNRTPVKTNKPLPWDRCYHASCLDVKVCLPQSHFDYANAFVMDETDWFRTQLYLHHDVDLSRANQNKAKGGTAAGATAETSIGQSKEKLEAIHLPPDLSPQDTIVDALDSVQPKENQPENAEADHTPIHDSVDPPVTHVVTCSKEAPSDGKQHKYNEDGSIDWFAESDKWGYSPDDDDDDVSYHSDASQSVRWLDSDDELYDEDGDCESDYQEGLVPFNPLLEALMPFTGDMPNGTILPMVTFSPDLSGIPTLLSVKEFYKDYDALLALVKKCREGPSMPIQDLSQPAPASAADHPVVNDANVEEDSPTPKEEVSEDTAHKPRQTDWVKRLKKVGSLFPSSGITKLFRDVLCKQHGQ